MPVSLLQDKAPLVLVSEVILASSHLHIRLCNENGHFLPPETQAGGTRVPAGLSKSRTVDAFGEGPPPKPKPGRSPSSLSLLESRFRQEPKDPEQPRTGMFSSGFLSGANPLSAVSSAVSSASIPKFSLFGDDEEEAPAKQEAKPPGPQSGVGKGPPQQGGKPPQQGPPKGQGPEGKPGGPSPKQQGPKPSGPGPQQGSKPGGPAAQQQGPKPGGPGPQQVPKPVGAGTQQQGPKPGGPGHQQGPKPGGPGAQQQGPKPGGPGPQQQGPKPGGPGPQQQVTGKPGAGVAAKPSGPQQQELNLQAKDQPPNYNTCTQCKQQVCSLCGFSPPDSAGKEWLCLNCQMQRAVGGMEPPGPPMMKQPPKQGSAPPSPQRKEPPSGSPSKGEPGKKPPMLTKQQSIADTGKGSTPPTTPKSGPQPGQLGAKRGQPPPLQKPSQSPKGSPQPSPAKTTPKQDGGGFFGGFGLGGLTEVTKPSAGAQATESVAGKLFGGFGGSTKPQAGSTAQASESVTGKLFSGFSGLTESAKPTPASSQSAESVSGKMFGFGSSILSSATNLISGEESKSPPESPPGSPPDSPIGSEADSPPGSLPDSGSESPPETPPAYSKDTASPKPTAAEGKASADMPPPKSTEVEESSTPVSGSEAQSCCPLCKVKLNMGSGESPNYSICTECQKSVCNLCGFNPTPHLSEKEWLCLNCQTQRALSGQLGDMPPTPSPSKLPAKHEPTPPSSPARAASFTHSSPAPTATATPAKMLTRMPSITQAPADKSEPVSAKVDAKDVKKTDAEQGVTAKTVPKSTQVVPEESKEQAPGILNKNTEGVATITKQIVKEDAPPSPHVLKETADVEQAEIVEQTEDQTEVQNTEKSEPEQCQVQKTEYANTFETEPERSKEAPIIDNVIQTLLVSEMEAISEKEIEPQSTETLEPAKEIKMTESNVSSPISKGPHSQTTEKQSEELSLPSNVDTNKEEASVPVKESELLRKPGEKDKESSPMSTSDLAELESTVLPILQAQTTSKEESKTETPKVKRRLEVLPMFPEPSSEDDQHGESQEQKIDVPKKERKKLLVPTDIQRDSFEDSSEGEPSPKLQRKKTVGDKEVEMESPMDEEDFIRKQIIEMSADEDASPSDEENIARRKIKDQEKTQTEPNAKKDEKYKLCKGHKKNSISPEDEPEWKSIISVTKIEELAKGEQPSVDSGAGMRHFKTIELNSAATVRQISDDGELESLTDSPDDRSRDSDSSSPSHVRSSGEGKQQRKAKHRSGQLPTIEDSSEEDEMREEEELLREQEKQKGTGKKSKKDNEEIRAQRRRERPKTPPSNLSPIEDASPTEELRQEAEMEEFRRSSCSDLSPSMESEPESFEILPEKIVASKEKRKHALKSADEAYEEIMLKEPEKLFVSAKPKKPLRSPDEVYEDMMQRKKDMMLKEQEIKHSQSRKDGRPLLDAEAAYEELMKKQRAVLTPGTSPTQVGPDMSGMAQDEALQKTSASEPVADDLSLQREVKLPALASDSQDATEKDCNFKILDPSSFPPKPVVLRRAASLEKADIPVPPPLPPPTLPKPSVYPKKTPPQIPPRTTPVGMPTTGDSVPVRQPLTPGYKPHVPPPVPPKPSSIPAGLTFSHKPGETVKPPIAPKPIAGAQLPFTAYTPTRPTILSTSSADSVLNLSPSSEITTEVQRTTVSVVHERTPPPRPIPRATGISQENIKPEPAQLQNGHAYHPGEVVDLRTPKIDAETSMKGVDLSSSESRRQSLAIDSGGRQQSAVQSSVVNLSTDTSSVSVVTDNITILTCTATVAYVDSQPEKPINLSTTMETGLSGAVDLTTVKPAQTVVAMNGSTAEVVTAVITEDDGKPVDLTAGRRAVCCDVVYKLPFASSCTTQQPSAPLPEDRFGYRDDHYQYNRTPYGMRGLGGIKPSMSDTNLAEAGLFLYKSKHSYDYKETTEGAVDLTSGKMSVAGEAVDYSNKSTGVCTGMTVPQYTQARITSAVGTHYGVSSVLRSSNGIVYSSVAAPVPSTYAITTQPGSIFITSYNPLSGMHTSDTMPSLSTLQNQPLTRSHSFLSTIAVTTAEEQSDLPLNLETVVSKADLSTTLSDVVSTVTTVAALDTYTNASLEAIAASLEALSSPLVPGDGQYQMERELLEIEKMKQQRLAEELEWERQEIQRFREQEQLLVQKELEELQAMKQQILCQQEEERQAHLMMQKETYAQQQEQLEQIQRLQEQLRQQLEEQKFRQMYTGEILPEALVVAGERKMDSGCQTDEEDNTEKAYTAGRKKKSTKKSVDSCVQTDDEDQDEWEVPARGRRSRPRGGKNGMGERGAVSVQALTEISVQTDSSGTLKGHSVQVDTRLDYPDSDRTSSPKRRPIPLDIGQSPHLKADASTLQVVPGPPKSPKVLYSPISPCVSPSKSLEYLSYEKSLGDTSPQRIRSATDLSKGPPTSPRAPKVIQRSMSDPKPMSPTAEERAAANCQYSEGYSAMQQNSRYRGKGSPSGTPSGTQKKVKRTLPNPPSEEEAVNAGQTAYSTGSARRRLCRSTNMARAKILQDIDRELDLVERESSKLRKKQAELDEEEKEIDAKLRYLEMGINRRKEALLKEREKRERAYLQSVAEDRDYMSDSETKHDQYGKYYQYPQYQQSLYQPQSPYQSQSMYSSVPSLTASQQQSYHQMLLLQQKARQQAALLSELDSTKISTNYDTSSYLGGKYDLEQHQTPRSYMLLEDAAELAKSTGSLSSASYGIAERELAKAERLLRHTAADVGTDYLGSSSRLHSYGKAQDDEDPMEEPFELKLLKQQLKQEFRRSTGGTESLEQLAGLSHHYTPSTGVSGGSYRAFPKTEKYSISRLTLEKQAAKQLPTSVLYQKHKTTSNIGKSSRLLQDEITFGLRKNIAEQQKYLGSTLGANLAGSLNLGQSLNLSPGMRSSLGEDSAYPSGTEGDASSDTSAFQAPSGRSKPTSLAIVQSGRGRIPIVAQNSEEESPLSPVGQPMDPQQQHLREDPSRGRGYVLMDDLQGTMSDSEAERPMPIQDRNGLGIRVVGGKEVPCSNGDIGAYVAKVLPGGAAEQMGKIVEGMQVLEWNSISLTGKTYEEVQGLVGHQVGEAEICVRLSHLDIQDQTKGDRPPRSPGVDPKQLAAELQKVSQQQVPSSSASALDKASVSAGSSAVPSPGQPGSPSVSKKRHSKTSEAAKTQSHPVSGEIQLRKKTLEVSVWDYDKSSANDFLGEVLIDLSNTAQLDNVPRWLPLKEQSEGEHHRRSHSGQGRQHSPKPHGGHGSQHSPKTSGHSKEDSPKSSVIKSRSHGIFPDPAKDTQVPTIEKSHSSPSTSKPSLSEGQARPRAHGKSGTARAHLDDASAPAEAAGQQPRLQPIVFCPRRPAFQQLPHSTKMAVHVATRSLKHHPTLPPLYLRLSLAYTAPQSTL
ncbi:hypothetical protein cypCar_00002257 [Cyprinus carpio]|nr:hypothetical protein cypCar_00002257 [Cyprinus carpio]